MPAAAVELREKNAAAIEGKLSDPLLVEKFVLAVHRACTLPRELTRHTAGKAHEADS